MRSLTAALIMVVAVPLAAGAQFLGLDRDGDLACTPEVDMGITDAAGGAWDTVDVFVNLGDDLLLAGGATFCVYDSLSIENESFVYTLPPEWNAGPTAVSDNLPDGLSAQYPRMKCFLVQFADFTVTAPMESPARIGSFIYRIAEDGCVGFVFNDDILASGWFDTQFQSGGFDGEGQTCPPFDCPPAPIMIVESEPSCPLPTIPAGVGWAGEIRFTAIEGETPYIWSASGLPAGVTIDEESGVVAGQPAESGDFTFTVRVDDAEGSFDERPCSLTVVDPVRIDTDYPECPLPTADYGEPYEGISFIAQDGVPPYQWSATGLPFDLEISPATGEITGRPFQGGTFVFTVQVTDGYTSDSRDCELTVLEQIDAFLGLDTDGDFSCDPIVDMGDPNMKPGTRDTSDLFIDATIDGYSWECVFCVDDSLVASLEDFAYNTPTGWVDDPFVVGSEPASGYGNAYPRMKCFRAASSDPSETVPLAFPAILGSLQYEATGGGCVSFLLDGDRSAYGTVDGREFAFDASGSRCEPLNCWYPVLIDPDSPECPLPVARPGTSYPPVATFAAEGGWPPYVWSQEGLPGAMDIDAATGLIQGTADEEGVYPFEVTVTDSVGYRTERPCSIEVKEVTNPLDHFAVRMKDGADGAIPGLAGPDGMLVEPNVPNPFNPTTTISFVTAAPANRARVEIYTATGGLVRTLLDGPLGAGRHDIEWDGRNGRGEPAGSGVYFSRVSVDALSRVRKMTLIR